MLVPPPTQVVDAIGACGRNLAESWAGIIGTFTELLGSEY
jgi:hypothetical protein